MQVTLDVHENQMLRTSIQNEEGIKNAVAMGNVFFSTYLLSTFAGNDSDIYATCNHFCRIRQLIHTLFSTQQPQSKLATIINVNENHWVSVIVAFDNEPFVYGDSLGGTPDAKLVSAFSRCISIHSGRDFRLLKLVVTKQLDGYSCDFLCFNALEHFFFLATFRLPTRERSTKEGWMFWCVL